ncbi:hypothetical protein AVEN_198527-1 [Araneus ventricosus]|uniref:Endonuclease/exonuclease/phosphatase domain-containing protein n=1 Tax=Araneus ventricosus TaxID=182803 RepID=A0A4Y2LNE0_ARAVE|nr:hypothetical protein AVEN_198527-1 [Araneus ventricosus]
MRDINNLSESNSSTPTVSKLLSLFYQNVRGLRTKTKDFFSSLASVDQDVISITNTWLSEDIDSLELFDDRYMVFRWDRDSSSNSCRRGGGFLIAIKSDFLPVFWICWFASRGCLDFSQNKSQAKNACLCCLFSAFLSCLHVCRIL